MPLLVFFPLFFQWIFFSSSFVVCYQWTVHKTNFFFSFRCIFLCYSFIKILLLFDPPSSNPSASTQMKRLFYQGSFGWIVSIWMARNPSTENEQLRAGGSFSRSASLSLSFSLFLTVFLGDWREKLKWNVNFKANLGWNCWKADLRCNMKQLRSLNSDAKKIFHWHASTDFQKTP